MSGNHELDDHIDRLVREIKEAKTTEARNVLWHELWTACAARLDSFTRWSAWYSGLEPSELLEETMIALFEQIDVIDPDNVCKWLRAVMNRKRSTLYTRRSRRAKREVSLDAVTHFIAVQDDTGSRQDTAVYLINAHRIALGEDNYEILHMRVIQGLGFAECALALGVTRVTATNRFEAACKELKRCIDRSGKNRRVRP